MISIKEQIGQMDIWGMWHRLVRGQEHETCTHAVITNNQGKVKVEYLATDPIDATTWVREAAQENWTWLPADVDVSTIAFKDLAKYYPNRLDPIDTWIMVVELSDPVQVLVEKL